MLFAAVIALLLALSHAYPVNLHRQISPQCDGTSTSRILRYDPSTAATEFTFLLNNNEPSEVASSAELKAYEFLFFNLTFPLCSSIDRDDCLTPSINSRRLSSDLFTCGEGCEVARVRLVLDAYDQSGVTHTTYLHTRLDPATPSYSDDGETNGYRQTLTLELSAVADRPVEKQVITINWLRWSDHIDVLDMTFAKGEKVNFGCLSDKPAMSDHVSEQTRFVAEPDEAFIADEIEALQLLQEQAFHLQNEISMRKSAVTLAQARLHTQTPLDQVIHECDGMVCAAQALLTRIHDKITLATTSEAGYSKLQNVLASSKEHSASDLPPSYHSFQSTQRNSTSQTAHSFSGDFGTSEGYLLKTLTYIATVLGVLAVCAYIKKKCMSMRKRVERAADREERRNARAYRRAARRAQLKQQWLGFFRSISCFSCFSTSVKPDRLTDYDEKRALILQDALLEQDFDQAEQGQVMEAQIRELRNAHQIVSNILQRRTAPKPPRKDPPPPLVPLPHTPEARSRSSTSTLPSYDSASLPDYSSLPEPTGEHNVTTDGFARYVPSSSTSEQVQHSSQDSVRTRSTPISSVAGLSPRVSAETLRTRYSKEASDKF